MISSLGSKVIEYLRAENYDKKTEKELTDLLINSRKDRKPSNNLSENMKALREEFKMNNGKLLSREDAVVLADKIIAEVRNSENIKKENNYKNRDLLNFINNEIKQYRSERSKNET